MAAPNKTGANLLALTAAALSLPGYSGKSEAWAEPESDAAYRFSLYSESALPAAVTNGRDGSRYEVQTHQFHLLRPWGEEYDYTADLTIETMSGASPWFIVPGNNGKPIQVMSGATIDDNRVALDFKGRRYRESGRDSLHAGFSRERDYLSLSGGLETEQELGDGSRTFSAGLGYSHDELSPTDGASSRFPDRVASASKQTLGAYAGLSQIIDAQTLVQISVSFDRDTGYLSDPYKQAFVETDLLPDTRPQERNQHAVSARLRHWFGDLRAALHLNYRYFRDSWGITSNAAELAWYQNLGRHWKFVPALRWYEQDTADFYQSYFTSTRSDGHYSSDYRLSGFGALTLRLGTTYEAPRWTASLAVERYDSEGAYRIGGMSEENPGLVDFSVFSASFSYRFY